MVLRGRGTPWRLLLNPKLSLGEAYMDGSLVPLGSSIHDVLAVVLANLDPNPSRPWSVTFDVRRPVFGGR